jgi:hypothetical protein
MDWLLLLKPERKKTTQTYMSSLMERTTANIARFTTGLP